MSNVHKDRVWFTDYWTVKNIKNNVVLKTVKELKNWLFNATCSNEQTVNLICEHHNQQANLIAKARIDGFNHAMLICNAALDVLETYQGLEPSTSKVPFDYEKPLTSIDELEQWIKASYENHKRDLTEYTETAKTKHEKRRCRDELNGYEEALEMVDCGIQALKNHNLKKQLDGKHQQKQSLDVINSQLPCGVDIELKNGVYHLIIGCNESIEGDMDHHLSNAVEGFETITDALIGAVTYLHALNDEWSLGDDEDYD